GLDARRLAELAERRGALLEPGDVYFLGDPPPLNHFRLGYAATPAAAIDPGIRVVADVVHSLLR
ncbi:MAG TPA: PLP-dependent aminotransferase family protein, partial [Streptosporangiales bacterium]